MNPSLSPVSKSFMFSKLPLLLLLGLVILFGCTPVEDDPVMVCLRGHKVYLPGTCGIPQFVCDEYDLSHE